MGHGQGLQGDAIPFLSRILTVADAFDAMTTNRIYKPRKQIAEALTELASLSGSQFHPQVVSAAIKALVGVTSPDVTQAPDTEIEKKRFSYFFNDRLTGLFNEDYLKIFLQNNLKLHDYTCLHILHLTNVVGYNKREGWEQGNTLFQKFSAELQIRFPDALIFRAYGNDFAIFTRTHFDLAIDAFTAFTSIAGSDITVEPQHIDLLKNQAYSFDKFDKMAISCSL